MTFLAPQTSPNPEIANAIADAAEARPFLGTPEKTAALMTSWAFHESSFRVDAKGDGGRSVGLFQIQPRTVGLSSDVWILEDPGYSARTASRLLERSLHLCRGMARDQRGAWYASGKCNAAGARASRIRFATAERLVSQ